MHCKHGPDGQCGRKVVVASVAGGVCMSHYRRWRAGKLLDTPIRGYQRYEEGPDGKPVLAPSRRPARAPARRKPFEAEYALLRSLGLR
jgi:hypothetical protein